MLTLFDRYYNAQPHLPSFPCQRCTIHTLDRPGCQGLTTTIGPPASTTDMGFKKVSTKTKYSSGAGNVKPTTSSVDIKSTVSDPPHDGIKDTNFGTGDHNACEYASFMHHRCPHFKRTIYMFT